MSDRYWHMTYLQRRDHGETRVIYQGMCISKNEHPFIVLSRWAAGSKRRSEDEATVLLSWRELDAEEIEAMKAGGSEATLPEEWYDQMIAIE